MKKSVTFIIAASALATTISLKAFASVAPSISNFDGEISYMRGQGPVMVDEDVSITAQGNKPLTAVAIRITNPQEGYPETLSVDTSGTNIQEERKNGILVLKDAANAGEYTQVLRTLSYQNSINDASVADRVIEVIASNGLEVARRSKHIRFQASAIDNVKEENAIQEQAESYYQEQATYAADDSNYANSGMRGMSLRDVLVATYNYNKELKAARAELRATDELASQALSEWFPTVSLGGERGRTIVDRGAVHTNDIAETRRADASLPIFNGGQSFARLKRDKNTILAEREELANIEQQVLLDAVVAYMDIVKNQEILKVSRENEGALKRYLDATQERFSLGEVTQTDLSQAYTRHSRSVSERLQYEGELASSSAVFERIVGQPPVGLYLDQAPLPYDLSEANVISNAIENNPLIKRAQFNKKAAKIDIWHKAGALLPTVSVDASYVDQEGGYLGFGIDEIETKSILAKLHIPIYQSGAEYSRIRQAKREAEKAEFDLLEQRNLV